MNNIGDYPVCEIRLFFERSSGRSPVRLSLKGEKAGGELMGSRFLSRQSRWQLTRTRLFHFLKPGQ